MEEKENCFFKICAVTYGIAVIAFILVMIFMPKDALSGIIGSVITAIVAWLALKQAAESSKEALELNRKAMDHNTEALKFQNQLTLREMFATKSRKEAHKLIIDYVNQIAEIEDMSEIYDYLGIFEIAYAMLENGMLEKEIFLASYEYRLIIIKTAIEKGLLKNDDPKYWKFLNKLLKEYIED